MPELAPKAAVIGVFDGVHLGHQTLLKALGEQARQRNLQPMVITFDPPPSLYFNPQFHYILSTRKEKENLLRSCGIKEIVFLDFEEIADTEPEEFITRELTGRNIKLLMVAKGFHFGKDRKGSVKLLESLSHSKGYELRIITKMRVDAEAISATRIRELLLLGHIGRANQLLGYEYRIEGVREKGLGRAGALLGTPTVNMQPAHRFKLVPPDGIYAVRFGAQKKPAVCYIGSSPSFGDGIHRIETHLIDEKPMDSDNPLISFVERLRPDKRFHSLEELKKQVRSDVEDARRVLRRVPSQN
jgi:riboflavin kinase / FMN adenylyltransferase